MSLDPKEHKPTTLDEAINVIVENLEAEEIEWIKTHDPCETHHWFGRDIRNAWLWNTTNPLHQFFSKEYGLGHADDMSALILEGVKAKVTNTTFDFKAEAERFQVYWRKAGYNPLTMEPFDLRHA